MNLNTIHEAYGTNTITSATAATISATNNIDLLPSPYMYGNGTSSANNFEVTNIQLIPKTTTMITTVKVVVVKVTRFKKSKLIKTSEVIKEGWITKDPSISLELQVYKHFDLPVADLDSIIIKEVLSFNIQ
jgi:hypothetical protein